jgi:hypothetical protein
MSISRNRFATVAFTGASALAIALGPLALSTAVAPAPAGAQPCYNGYIPGNPYIANCALPPRQGGAPGSAPDAQAIIACRNWPGCLGWYVNGPR